MKDSDDAWPADWIGSLDPIHQRFVDQRFVLGAYTEDAAATATDVQGLLTCVTSGGYLELQEGNINAVYEEP